MYTDIVFPDGNEKEFISIAEKLGYKILIFVYDDVRKIPAKKSTVKLKTYTALTVNEKEIQKLKSKADLIFVKSTGDDRWVFEKSQADIIFGLEEAQKKDFMHHRASGLNQVLCRIAAKKEKKIAFSFSSILNSKAMLRAQLLGKMMQNTRFCRKFKVKTIIASFAKTPYQMRSPQELTAFGITIGMHPKEASDSLDWGK